MYRRTEMRRATDRFPEEGIKVWNLEEMEDQHELALLRKTASYGLLSREDLERLLPGTRIVHETPRSFFVEKGEHLTWVSKIIP